MLLNASFSPIRNILRGARLAETFRFDKNQQYPSKTINNTPAQTTFPSLRLIKGKQTVGAGVVKNQAIVAK